MDAPYAVIEIKKAVKPGNEGHGTPFPARIERALNAHHAQGYELITTRIGREEAVLIFKLIQPDPGATP